jgi:hypothetical protein
MQSAVAPRKGSPCIKSIREPNSSEDMRASRSGTIGSHPSFMSSNTTTRSQLRIRNGVPLYEVWGGGFLRVLSIAMSIRNDASRHRLCMSAQACSSPESTRPRKPVICQRRDNEQQFLQTQGAETLQGSADVGWYHQLLPLFRLTFRHVTLPIRLKNRSLQCCPGLGREFFFSSGHCCWKIALDSRSFHSTTSNSAR